MMFGSVRLRIPSCVDRRLLGRRQRRGFTLVELLVVIAIIGILVALLLPAVQAAREAARRTQCKNHLKQLGLGMLMHENQFKRFPSGGWGWDWVGEPERGTDKTQPGGWAFNMLAFIEQEGLREMGLGMTGTARTAAIIQRCQTPIPTFYCPSRRAARAYPDYEAGDYKTSSSVSMTLERSGRTDYAVNCGDQPWNELTSGPHSIAIGDGAFFWTEFEEALDEHTGICYLRSEVTVGQIEDGTSNTYLIGEKYLNISHYDTGLDDADNENVYVGYDNDTSRSSHPGWGAPRADRDDATGHIYGSAHSAGFHMVLCDGSVRTIVYSIDQEIHRRLGNRGDGQTVDLEGL